MRQEFAQILKGRKIADHVRCIVIPATQKIFNQCIEEGLAQIFVDAGAVFSTPTCGPCLGAIWVSWEQEKRPSLQPNRNFLGRIGDIDSEICPAMW